MKVAACQLKSTESVSDNLTKTLCFLSQAVKEGAEFIVFPEAVLYRGDLSKFVVQNKNGAFFQQELNSIKDFAKKNTVWILLGSVLEKSRNKLKPYNSSILINTKGIVTAVYRKRNLFEAYVEGKHIIEASNFTQGRKYVVANVNKMKVGLSICYDLRFPQVYQHLRKTGAQIFCIPSAFTYETGKFHWEALLKSRAIENLSYVVAPNQCGKDTNHVSCWGNSMIIDPWGKILAKASVNKECIIYSDINLAVLKNLRKKLPHFA